MRMLAVVFLVSLWLGGSHAQDPSIVGVIQDIFNETTTASSRPTRRPGIGDIVTSEPITSTSEPQVLATDDGVKCVCVPYYLCRPDDNTIRDDGEIDGFGKIDIRFDPYSCQHYLDVCCIDNRTLTEAIVPVSVVDRPNQPKGCGIRNTEVDFQITGNNQNEANFGELPWTVALLDPISNKYTCAGSLIHPQVVLTAAHCVNRPEASKWVARAGEWDSQTTRERLPYQEKPLRQLILHPEFNSKSLANDFALLVLTEPITLADHINVVCLPPANVIPAPGAACLSSGWGRDIFGTAGKYSVIMKRVPLPAVPFNECQDRLRRSRLGKYFQLHPSFMCAGGQANVDTCEGDGGGPLVCPAVAAENRYYQSGIVAWGLGCNDPIPAAYGNVAFARQWIDSQMTTLGFGTASYTY